MREKKDRNISMIIDRKDKEKDVMKDCRGRIYKVSLCKFNRNHLYIFSAASIGAYCYFICIGKGFK